MLNPALLILLLVCACGKKTSNKFQDPLDKVVLTTISNNPIFLEKQTPTCQLKNFDTDEINHLLYLFIEGRPASSTENFIHLISGNHLKDQKTIKTTTYGEEVELVYTRPPRSIVKSEGKEVNICPEVKVYSSNTIESVALNVSHYIKKTNQKFLAVIPDIKLPAVDLSIAPKILISHLNYNEEGELIKNSAYWTDNALYLPGSDTIAYLPTSKEFRQQGFNLNFWEVPMVASHEYGHHIFKYTHGHSHESLAVHNCFGHELPKKKTSKRKKVELRYVSVADVLTAINEGFADLISYYTLDKSESGVSGVHCLQVSRDVSSPWLINRRIKKLNNAVIGNFFSPYSDAVYGGCHNPSYQEVHILGAVIAHTIEEFFNSLSLQEEDKIKTITKWVQLIGKDHQNLKQLNSKIYFERVMASFFQISLSLNNFEINRSNCDKIQNVYPDGAIRECLTLE